MKKLKFLIIFILGSFSLSFADENITITTYYPSPYGVYNELTTTSNAYLATTEGNVGIGTTSPQSLSDSGPMLHVLGSGTKGGEVMVSNSDNSRFVGVFSGSTMYGGQPTIAYPSSYPLLIGTWNNINGNVWSEKVRIDTTGNVGIGTTNSGWGLQVHSASNHQYVVVSTGTASRDTGIQFMDSSGVVWYPRHGSDGKFHITYYNPSTSINTPYLSIDRMGNVSIGTTSPQTPAPNAAAGNLDVNDIYLRSTAKWSSQSYSYTYYCFTNTSYGIPACTNAGGAQGYCPSGYTQKASLGSWGGCSNSGGVYAYFRPPGTICTQPSYGPDPLGQAYVCSQ